MENHEFENYLATILRDRALANHFRANNPRLMTAFRSLVDLEDQENERRLLEHTWTEPLVSMPAFAEITALQTSLFDNWLSGDKTGVRYKATFSAYTTETVNFMKKPTWTANVAMWPNKTAMKMMKETKRNAKAFPISDATVAEVAGLVESGADYVGLMRRFAKGHGTRYFSDHFAVMNMTNAGDPELIVWTPVTQIKLVDWSGTDARGKPLVGNVWRHSRHTTLPSMMTSSWATGSVISN